MYIQTDRLIIRDLTKTDVESLLEIKYGEQVLKYDPTFIKRDAKVTDVIEYINSLRNDILTTFFTVNVMSKILMK